MFRLASEILVEPSASTTRRLSRSVTHASIKPTAPSATGAIRVYESKRPVEADPASGLHFSFIAPTRESVSKFHAAALKAGGKDNGKPDLRKDYGDNYYAAFVVDPDGYRIEAHCEADR
jgi:catechol 2,3-dioxygenase-like lactoylglutathione lyase family enzyme